MLLWIIGAVRFADGAGPQMSCSPGAPGPSHGRQNEVLSQMIMVMVHDRSIDVLHGSCATLAEKVAGVYRKNASYSFSVSQVCRPHHVRSAQKLVELGGYPLVVYMLVYPSYINPLPGTHVSPRYWWCASNQQSAVAFIGGRFFSSGNPPADNPVIITLFYSSSTIIR